MNTINELLSIENIVKNNFFKIPDYQRGYSWEEHQIADLIKDIEHVSKIDYKHYTGTIVITKNETLGKYEVVDGQQRLTTIIILLKQIYETDRVKYAEIKENFIVRNHKYVLETNEETKVYFKEAILNDKKHLPEDIKSLNNLKFAKEFIRNWLTKNPSQIESIYKTIIKKLGFICFSPTNDSEIGIMFEVINNRGKELSELEKIKNYFIYYSTINSQHNLREKVNDNWRIILRYLSKANIINNEEENRFLRNCYLVFFSTNKNRSWYVYDELKDLYSIENVDNINIKIREIEHFIDFLQQAAQSYAFLSNGDYFNTEFKGDNKERLKTVLKQLRCHPVNASILPLYLATMSYLYDRTEDVVKLLEIIEKLNFRLYVLENPYFRRADSKQGDLFQWASELYQDRNWKTNDSETVYKTYLDRTIEGDIFDYTTMILEDFTIYYSPEESIIQSLTIDNDEAEFDFYNWKGIRFFLASYEEYLNNKKRSESWEIEKILITREEAKGEKANDYLSKEHIWAKENMSDDFHGRWKERRRLGNFALLGMKSNIQLQNWSIKEKIDYMIENSSISMLQIENLKGYLEKATKVADSRRERKTKYYYLDEIISVIDQRENDLIKFALKRWKMPSEKFNRFIKIDAFEANAMNQSHNYFLKN